jgi:hypothetical protein
VECDFAGDDLMTGMIYRSLKALDLRRDPRATVHSLPPGKDNPDGDIKLYGRLVELHDRALKQAYEDAIHARIQWRPSEPYHCFAVDVESAGYLRYGEEAGAWEIWTWRPGTGLAKEVRKAVV